MQGRTYIMLVAIVLGFILSAAWIIASRPSARTPVEQTAPDFMVLQLASTTVHAELADTPTARTQGLSGRRSLVEGTGMLFVFAESKRHAFWMPDMHLALDIIWLDEGMRVVHVEENVPPESYPERFKPDEPARYVLEVPAGFAARHGVGDGTQVYVQ